MCHRKISFFTTLFFILSVSCYGSSCDSLKKDSIKIAEVKNKPRFVFALDFRNSFVRQSPVSIYGFQTGVKFRKKHLLALGFYTLTLQAQNFNKSKNKVTPIELDLFYGSLNYAYSIINYQRFEVSIPLEAGFGVSHVTPLDPHGNPLPKIHPKQSSFVPLQAGIKLEWRVFRWAGLIGSVGYRNSVLQTDFRQNFDGFYYHIGAVLYLGNIIGDVKTRKVRKISNK